MKAARNERIGPCGSGREQFLKNIENRVLPSLRAFKPELIILSAGFDAAKDDVGNVKLDTGKGGIDLSTKGKWDSCCTYMYPPSATSQPLFFFPSGPHTFLSPLFEYMFRLRNFDPTISRCRQNVWTQ